VTSSQKVEREIEAIVQSLRKNGNLVDAQFLEMGLFHCHGYLPHLLALRESIGSRTT
jgi:hypothetical protein